MSAFFDKVKAKAKDRVSDLATDFEALKTQVTSTYNPNHRHDEEHEKEKDRIQTEICESHRFKSFAMERTGSQAKWYIDGHDYFYALSEILEKARECIFIADWWLTPELYLRRPPAKHEQWRLDRTLKRAAERGVKVYVMVYKEVTQSMTMSSAHTKHALEDLHENIACVRHPDHVGGEVTLYWSHHEKIVVVDNVWACVGGLDLCFGRWDTHNAPLTDAHPNDFSRTLFPGQDYNNARIMDFQAVDHWVDNAASRLETPRMPWHDVHMMVIGPIVLDVAQHFCERWNFIRYLKYRHDHRYHVLDFPHDYTEPTDEPVARHPHLDRFKQGMKFSLHHQRPEEGGVDPHGGPGPKGNMRIQALRSSADWSHGILTEHSIQNAYIQMIREASHYIYIENQFFVTATSKGSNGVVENQIGAAIAERVISAAQAGKPFKVVIVIPAVPGFAGDVKSSGGTLAIMHATYASISRGPKSIMGLIEAAGFNPHDYIECFNLRSYDRLHDISLIREMEQKSGVTWDQAQAALARLYIGDVGEKYENEYNATITIKNAPEGESLKPGETKNSKEAVKTVPVPKTVVEAREQIERFEAADPARDSPPVIDSVAHHALQSGKCLMDEPWLGDKESEKMSWVTEELYIHSKLMIVDDRRVIMGSANLNDRSQNGDHDSEIALVVEDDDLVPSFMAGRKFEASRFAATLRRQLYRQHLGLIQPQHCPSDRDEDVAAEMRMVGIPPNDFTGDREDQLVADPLGEELTRLMRDTAHNNTQAFDSVFHCVPTDQVRDWKDYAAWVPGPPNKVGHIASSQLDAEFCKSTLTKVRGHLVEMPLLFLDKVNMIELSASVNAATMQIYI